MAWGVLGLVLVVRIIREYLGVGFGGINYMGSLLLAVGWGIGYWLADIDHLFYALVCNPQELSCMRVKQLLVNRSWSAAWKMLKETQGERIRMPIHNTLTGLIMTVMAIWTVTSSGSLLASGVAVGLSVRLLIEFWRAADYTKWYWLIARPIVAGENKIVKWVWTGLTILCCIFLLR